MTDQQIDQNRQLSDMKDSYDEKYGFSVPETGYAFKSRKGIDREIVAQISEMKNEPSWMRDFRLRSLDIFFKKPMPTWGGDMSGINFDDIYYFVRATDGQQTNWDDVPADVKYTFDRLGIPEAEQKFLAGASAQFESETVYHSIQKDLEDKGVIFTDTDSALRDYPELFREYFGTIIPPTDNKFAALNSAVWSGGSFIYVPPGVDVEMPLQAYFRINTRNMGQFERTLIIVDEGAKVHYTEGCTAPSNSSDSLHSAVVEIIVKSRARARYTTIQNWASNVYNLVTKRAVAYEHSTMEWHDVNIGCLAEGSTVTTPTGIKAIESVNIGEEVLSYDEKAGEFVFRKVMAKRDSGYQPVHTVTADGRELHVTANHPFYSYTVNPNAVNAAERFQTAYVRADHIKKVIVPREGSLNDASDLHRKLGLSQTVEIVNVNVSEPTTELIPTWDIEVEGTGNFVSQGFIVHNSRLTMKYPAIHLLGEGAHGETLSVAFAGKGQHQDAGSKIIHSAPNTSSQVVSKSISMRGGRSSYRGLLKVYEGATNSKSNVVCDALLMDEESRTDTYPSIEIDEQDVSIGHEASVTKVSEDMLFYLMSRGINAEQANAMVVSGFIEPIAKELPAEYSIELYRLVQLQMEGSVG